MEPIKLQLDYFKKYQQLLLWFANTKTGKSYLQIPEDLEVACLTPTAYHIYLDGKQYQATAYTRNVFTPLVMTGLLYVDTLVQLGKIEHFTHAVEAFLFALGLKKNTLSFPNLYLDTTGDITAVTAGDGNIFIDNGGTFATVRNATSGTSQPNSDNVNLYCSQLTSRSISRGFFPYTNPSIPSGSIIDSGTFKFTCTAVVAGSPTAHLVRSTQASASTLANTDYDNINEVPSTGAVTSCGSVVVTAALKTITINATGLAHVTPGANILFALMEAGDQSNTDPVTNDNRFTINTSDNGTAANRPTLNIVYTPPPAGGNPMFFSGGLTLG